MDMDNMQLNEAYASLSTPLIADACLRLDVPLRCAPPGIHPVIVGSHIAGRVLPVRHYGSVDVFFEAMMAARQGDVLVIDNRGRPDEGCIGDLTALEAKACGITGMVIWGFHRDTEELIRIGYPIFSYGACPLGPRRLDARALDALETACFGDFTVGKGDVVFVDGDGALFVPQEHVQEVIDTARTISHTEREQAEALEGGKKLRDLLRFHAYLDKRARDPDHTFREHLREIGGAIEE
jgi:4-hydroxy-4-methyl-2-oxoglutarate aldolase